MTIIHLIQALGWNFDIYIGASRLRTVPDLLMTQFVDEMGDLFFQVNSP